MFLRDLWPSSEDVHEAIAHAITESQFTEEYGRIWTATNIGARCPRPPDAFEWDPASTYVREPPFFEDKTAADRGDIEGRPCAGDGRRLDHHRPHLARRSDQGRLAGGQYLLEHGVEPRDFNSYGARRGNHEVMMRGTFANVRLRNELAPETEGGGPHISRPAR